MRKFIKNICMLSLCGVLLVSGCSSDKTDYENSPYVTEEGYEAVPAVTEMTTLETGTGNVGEVTISSGDVYAVIRVKDYGDIKIKLFPEEVPYGVQNFIDLAQQGYFDGKSIHRVMSDFMLQGGSLNGDGTGGTSAEGGEFSCEINKNMRHFYGALCYANAGGKNTCQFYIVNNKQPQTDIAGLYAQYSEYYEMQTEAYEGYMAQVEPESAEYAYIAQFVESSKSMANGVNFMKETLSSDIEAKYAEVGGIPFLDGGYTVFGQTFEGFDVIDKISAAEVQANEQGEESDPVKDILIDTVYIVAG